MSLSHKWPSQFVEGFQIPLQLSVDNFRSALNYKPRDDDIFVVTYPKCGTTWAIYTATLIFRHGKPLGEDFNVVELGLALELTGPKIVETMKRPGTIKTHLPSRLAPWSDKAKYIHVTRNPKDVCVSYFYHMRDTPGHGFEGTFDDFFEHFLSGDIEFGDYFDHLLGWYKHWNDPNVLFLTYEEMKENPVAAILKMASFMDNEKYAEPLRNNRQALENVMKYSSFKEMKGKFNKNLDKFFAMSAEDAKNSEIRHEILEIFSKLQEKHQSKYDSTKPKPTNLIRKGIVGDWRNLFSEEQSRRMNEKFAERTKNTDIVNLWKEHMS